MHWLDLLVLAAYGAFVVGVGLWANRRQSTTDDYLLGGRRLPWWAVGVSIMATSFSSAALVGGTAFGYAHGLRYLGLQLGDLLGFGLALWVLLPALRRLPITTAYELLEQRLGRTARWIGASVFLLQTLARVGLLVYAPALVLSTLLGWPVEWAIAATAGAALLYSAFGGISAVVWTDLVQVLVILVGGAATLVLLAGDVGWSAMWGAVPAAKLTLVEWDKPARAAFSLPWILVAYGVLALSVQGTNQQAVQRYLSCEDLGAARRAGLLGWAIGALAVGVSLVVGVAIGAWAAADPSRIPEGMPGEQVLAHVIATRLPPGLSGLLVAAIFAAAMSSLDSAIHSLSTSALVDVLRDGLGVRLSEGAELRAARLLTVGFGVLAGGVAILAVRWADQTLLLMMVTWLGYFAGPLLGLFLLALIGSRWDGVRERAAVAGTLVAFAVVAVLAQLAAPQAYGWHPLWLAPLATALTLGVALALEAARRQVGDAPPVVHALVPAPASLHGQFSRALAPCLTVASGDVVDASTLDVTWGLGQHPLEGDTRPKFPRQPGEKDAGPALCGPIAVEGLRVGDLLEVRIEALEPMDWGWTYAAATGFNDALIEGLGLTGEKALIRWTIDARWATSERGWRVPVRPFLGTIGLPAGAAADDGDGWQTGWHPRYTGGNLDCRELVVGTRLYLPVEVDGGLLSFGDAHAAQGDGELAGSAIECRLRSARLRLVRRVDLAGQGLDFAHADTPAGWVTFGTSEDLDEAVRQATDRMLRLIVARRGLSRIDALALCSAAADLRLTQVVNGVRGAHVVLRIRDVDGLEAQARATSPWSSSRA